jgi:hypothetical protein
MRTQPAPLQPLALEPGFTVAELDGAPTLTLRGRQRAEALADAAVPADTASGLESTGRAPAAPPSVTLTF